MIKKPLPLLVGAGSIVFSFAETDRSAKFHLISIHYIARTPMAKEDHKGKTLPQIVDILGIGKFDIHFFICTGPDCCDPEAGMAAWKVVKRTVKALNPDLKASRIYRTKVACLRICQSGPIAVAYPQGKWFHHVTEDNAEDIVNYLQSGAPGPHPLEFTEHPLPAPQKDGAKASDR